VAFIMSLLLAITLALGAGDNDAGTIPVVDRPNDLPFSEASGSFKVSARAEPTSLPVEQPLTLTLLVEADGPVFHSPQRIDLRLISDFNERFYIENPDNEEPPAPDAVRWEFVYVLKPRRTDVREIPGVPFVFYNPAIRPAKKAFQTKYTDAIPLKVQAAGAFVPPPRPVADVFLQTRTGPAVLTRQAPWSPPGTILVALLLLVPPLACAAWYVAWRRLNPDLGRQKEQRRSRAARHALARLQQAERAAVDQRALLTATAVADYLRERVDLTVAEPTPPEVGKLLKANGCSPAVVEQAIGFLQTCDAARFWPPVATDGAKLPALARDLILALDTDTEIRREPAAPPEESLS
jgi:hypothetical protein